MGTLTDLEELVANETSISDAGLAHVRVLPKLRSLRLSGTAVSDAGTQHLLELPLVLLDLSGTHVSDAGLECLSGIRSLQELWIIGCLASEGGLSVFRSNYRRARFIADIANQARPSDRGPRRLMGGIRLEKRKLHTALLVLEIWTFRKFTRSRSYPQGIGCP